MFGSVVVLVGDAQQWTASEARLRREGLYPEPVAAPPGSDHRTVWERAAVRTEPTLVLADDAGLVAGWRLAMSEAGEALAGHDWHVVHLDQPRAGAAYIVSPEGAALLLEAGPPGVEPAPAMAAVAPLDVVGLDPAVVEVVAEPSVLADEPDDLERLLRYQGAIALDAPLAVVGDELVTVPFWTPEVCAAVVRAADTLDAWDSDDLDPVPGDEVSLALLLPRLYAHVEDHLAASIVPQLRSYWPTLEFHGLRDAFVIRYPAGDAEGLRLHHDVAQVSGSVRLNDGYTGGELVFPRQGFTNRELAVGRLLLWPSLVTHPHAAERVRSGVKYGLTIWFEVPGGAEN